MISDTPDQREMSYQSLGYSVTFLKIGIIGTLAAAIGWTAYGFIFAAGFWGLYELISPMFIVLRVVVAIGFVGYLSKCDSNLAFPAMFVYLLPEVVDLFYAEVPYEIRLGIYVILYVALAIMMLTVRHQAGNSIVLYIFVIVAIAESFVPYFLQMLVAPLFLPGGEFIEILAWIAPYMIFDAMFYLSALVLFLTEVRTGRRGY